MVQQRKQQKISRLNSFFKEIKKPSSMLGVLGTIIGIIGAWPTVEGWLAGADIARLHVLHDTYIAYDPGSAVGMSLRQAGIPFPSERKLELTTLPDPPFKVIDDRGQVINETIWDVEVSVWNSGRAQLSHDKLRTPLTFIVPEADTILGVRMLKVNNLDGVSVHIKPDTKNTIESTWNYMDPGKGFKFSIIYAGKPPTLFSWKAYIDGELIDANASFLSQIGWMPIKFMVGTLLFIAIFFLIFDKFVKMSREITVAFSVIIIGASMLTLFISITRTFELVNSPFQAN